MYFPDGNVPSPDALGLERVEQVTFTTTDGLSIHGWFFPSPQPSSVTVLVCNGNAGNRAYRAPLASALRAHGMGVLLFDYRGFGENAGSPTERGLAADSRAARAYLLRRPDVTATRLVYSASRWARPWQPSSRKPIPPPGSFCAHRSRP